MWHKAGCASQVPQSLYSKNGWLRMDDWGTCRSQTYVLCEIGHSQTYQNQAEWASSLGVLQELESLRSLVQYYHDPWWARTLIEIYGIYVQAILYWNALFNRNFFIVVSLTSRFNNGNWPTSFGSCSIYLLNRRLYRFVKSRLIVFICAKLKAEHWFTVGQRLTAVIDVRRPVPEVYNNYYKFACHFSFTNRWISFWLRVSGKGASWG